jgi:hypothetical protein
LNDDVDEVYQEEESPPSLIVDPSAGLDDLVGDADDIEMCIVVMQKQKPIKKKFGCLDQGPRLPDHDADEFIYKYYFYS